jgi:RNA polymerase sigma-70 factor (ECF subfamily)
VLRLAYWDELSHRDIATVLGISAGAVTTRLHRARERLRECLVETHHTTSRTTASRKAETLQTKETCDVER